MDGHWPRGSGPVAHEAGRHCLLGPGWSLAKACPGGGRPGSKGSRVHWGLSEAWSAFYFCCYLFVCFLFFKLFS